MHTTWTFSKFAWPLYADFNDTLDGVWKFCEHIDHLKKKEKIDTPDQGAEVKKSIRWLLEAGKLHHTFPRLLNYSFLIHSWILLETSCLALCQHVASKQQSRFKIRDINGQGLERCLLFLNRLEVCQKQDLVNYEAIALINTLRNCIAHANGILEESKDRERIEIGLSRQYVLMDPMGDQPRKWIVGNDVWIEETELGHRLRFSQFGAYHCTAIVRNFFVELLIKAHEIKPE